MSGLIAANRVTERMPLFLQLSSRLAGEESLPPDLAAQYLNRLLALGPEMSAATEDLLETYHSIVVSGKDIDAGIRDSIFADARLRVAARRIIILWYLGELVDDADKAMEGPPQHFFRGLMWEIIHAHPLALSGGYFGYWKYPPEN
jgi:Membrane bound FAD containing D-sorbitol dehydrogenase